MVRVECEVCEAGFICQASAKRRFCSKKCMGKAFSGPNNPNARYETDRRYCRCGTKKDHRAKQCSACANRSTPVGAPQTEKPLTDEIQKAIDASRTIAGAARLAGVSRHTMGLLIRRNNVDISHFDRSSYRPSTPEAILVQHNRPSRNNGVVKSLILRENLLPYECAECSQGPEWNGKPLNLDLDHISGDWQDDRLENLRFLCPNCHSQTPTWKGRKIKGVSMPRKKE